MYVYMYLIKTCYHQLSLFGRGMNGQEDMTILEHQSCTHSRILYCLPTRTGLKGPVLELSILSCSSAYNNKLQVLQRTIGPPHLIRPVLTHPLYSTEGKQRGTVQNSIAKKVNRYIKTKPSEVKISGGQT